MLHGDLKMGRKSKKEGIYVHILIYFAAQQKLMQYYFASHVAQLGK